MNDLVRLHEATQKKCKTESYSKQIRILTLVPDKWSRMYYSEDFNVFEYLVLTSYEMKKVGGILAKPAPEKGKTITTETLHLVTNVYKDDNFSRYVPEKKDYVSVSKGLHEQKLCKRLCKLQKLYTAFKEKHLNVRVLKVLCLETQMVSSGWLNNDRLCLCL